MSPINELLEVADGGRVGKVGFFSFIFLARVFV